MNGSEESQSGQSGQTGDQSSASLAMGGDGAQTGDTNAPGLWLTLLFMSAAVCVAAVLRIKRKIR